MSAYLQFPSGGASTGSKATSERSTKAERFSYEASAYFFKELVATEDEGSFGGASTG